MVQRFFLLSFVRFLAFRNFRLLFPAYSLALPQRLHESASSLFPFRLQRIVHFLCCCCFFCFLFFAFCFAEMPRRTLRRSTRKRKLAADNTIKRQKRSKRGTKGLFAFAFSFRLLIFSLLLFSFLYSAAHAPNQARQSQARRQRFVCFCCLFVSVCYTFRFFFFFCAFSDQDQGARARCAR